jgi:hypothetical protein
MSFVNPRPRRETTILQFGITTWCTTIASSRVSRDCEFCSFNALRHIYPRGISDPRYEGRIPCDAVDAVGSLLIGCGVVFVERYLHPDEVFASLWELVAHYQEHGGIVPDHQFPVRLRFPFSSYASNPWYHGTLFVRLSRGCVARYERGGFGANRQPLFSTRTRAVFPPCAQKTGEVKKAGAEDMLRPARDGSFLVRQSQSGEGDLTLSLRVHDELHHYRIVRNDDKTFSLSKDIRFQTLEKLVQFYAREEGGGIPTLRKVPACASPINTVQCERFGVELTLLAPRPLRRRWHVSPSGLSIQTRARTSTLTSTWRRRPREQRSDQQAFSARGLEEAAFISADGCSLFGTRRPKARQPRKLFKGHQ